MKKLLTMNVNLHVGASAAAFGLFQIIKARLDASYAASNHPVDYATGQLAFDAATIEGYYAVMIEAGTLDIYWRTQMIDFGFIASIMLLSVLLGSLLTRIGGVGSWGYRAGIAGAVLGVSGAMMDITENLLSFAMLARPEQISQFVALAYSSAAAAKFALLTLAMLAMLLALFLGLGKRLWGVIPQRGH